MINRRETTPVTRTGDGGALHDHEVIVIWRNVNINSDTSIETRPEVGPFPLDYSDGDSMRLMWSCVPLAVMAGAGVTLAMSSRTGQSADQATAYQHSATGSGRIKCPSSLIYLLTITPTITVYPSLGMS